MLALTAEVLLLAGCLLSTYRNVACLGTVFNGLASRLGYEQKNMEHALDVAVDAFYTMHGLRNDRHEFRLRHRVVLEGTDPCCQSADVLH